MGQRLRRQIHLEVEALPHAAVEKVGGGLAEERLHLEGLFPQGLHGAVQPHGEIQVVHQIPDLLALGADDPRLPPALRRQILRPLHLGGVAHDHGERGADVVGHAVDPVGPGGVPHPLGLPEPPAHHEVGQEQHAPEGQQEDAADPQGRVVEQTGLGGDVVLPHAPLGRAHHQQSVLPDAALHRVVIEIPPGEGGHVREGILFRHVGGLAEGPDHLPVLADQDGPAVIPQQRITRKVILRPIIGQGVGDTGDRDAPAPAAVGVVEGEGQDARYGDNGDERRRGGHQHGPLENASQTHFVPSRFKR